MLLVMSLPASVLPDVWRAHELARSHAAGLDTGHAPLNAVLPGGGWPPAGLTELLQPRPGWAEWGLLAPALARLTAEPGRGRPQARRSPGPSASSRPRSRTVLVGTPHVPFGPALAACQLAPSHLLQAQARSLAERLWVADQALRCADVACVLLWLTPQVQPTHLRRLHLTAQEHAKLLFVFRPEQAQRESTPAPLRLMLRWQAPAPSAGAAWPQLAVHVLKRRGPPLPAPVLLSVATPGLRALLAASRAQAQLRRQFLPPVPAFQEGADALDRLASLV